MRLLTAILLTASFAAQAEWVLITESPDGSEEFIETSDRAKDGESVTVWHKSNNAAGQSYRVRVVYDCKNRTQQQVSLQRFSAHDFEGDAGQVDNKSYKPFSAAPETVAGVTLGYICGDK